jgi:hypothetical protein
MILKSDLIIFEQFCKKSKVKLGTKASCGYSKKKSEQLVGEEKLQKIGRQAS